LNADLPRAGAGILAFHGRNGASDTSGGALRFAQNGAIVGLEIIVRPFNAMQAVGAATGEAPGVLHRFRELLATRLALTRRPT